MRETARVSAAAIWTTIILCACIGILAIFSLGLQAKLMPWWFAVQRDATEQSKSFINSQTQAMLNKIVEYGKTEDASQKEVIYNLVCSQATEMAPGTVPSKVAVWLGQNGECFGASLGK